MELLEHIYGLIKMDLLIILLKLEPASAQLLNWLFPILHQSSILVIKMVILLRLNTLLKGKDDYNWKMIEVP